MMIEVFMMITSDYSTTELKEKVKVVLESDA